MSESKPPTKYEIVQPILLALMVILGIFMGRKIEQTSSPETKEYTKPRDGIKNNAAILEEAIRFIEARYVDSVDIHRISDLTLQALTKQLDPYSTYISSNRLTEDIFRSFHEAYGFRIKEEQKKYIVNQIDPYSNAWNSNLSVGDEIIKIKKGSPSINSFSQWNDSTLDLELRRPLSKGSIMISLSRNDSIRQLTVFPVIPLKQDVAYIKIIRFGDNTYDEFISALDTLINKHKTHHLIIDLRDNPGGYLEECSRILNQLFKEKNLLMVATEGRTVRKTEYRTDGRQLFDIDKIVVLINEKSASSSEVFAGAIQDLGRGKIIGQPSYGKGLVQEQYMLSNGGALRLSVAKYYLPSGRSIDAHRSKDTVHIFKNQSGQLIKSAKVIIPNILVKPDTSYTILNKENIQSRIIDECIKLKYQSGIQAISIKEEIVEKKIIPALALNWNKRNSREKEFIESTIAKTWSMITKNYAGWLKATLMEQPEIVESLKVL
ncbi:MAG: S41 family peptidase [Saprospiraceae bacterium]